MVEKVNYTDSKMNEREVVVLPIEHSKIAFYRSSGTSSATKDTWFPFFGMALDKEVKDKSPNSFYSLSKVLGAGVLIKPDQCFAFPEEKWSFLDKKSQNILTLDLQERFFLPVFALYSSQIGGGFWKSSEGKRIKNIIELHCKKNEIIDYNTISQCKKIVGLKKIRFINSSEHLQMWLREQNALLRDQDNFPEKREEFLGYFDENSSGVNINLNK